MMKTIAAALAMTVLALVPAGTAHADDINKQSVLTFSQPFEIPGRVLPAGTYMFKLADSMVDRHIVQIFNADGSQIIATVMAIPDFRLKATDQTVIKFREVPAGSPEAIRAWFYPGNTFGQEFVYSKKRAVELAKASKTVVPALAADVKKIDDLKTAPIVAITPEAKEAPVAAAIQTTPPDNDATASNRSSAVAAVAGTTGVQRAGQSARNATQLPKTASTLPLIVLLGFGSVAIAFGLIVFGKRDSGFAR